MTLAAVQTRLDESDSLTPKRRPDLQSFLDGLGPEVRAYMETHWTDHGEGWLPHESDPSLAIAHAYAMMKWIIENGYAPTERVPEVRDAMLQWLEDHKGIRTVSKKKDLPQRGRKMRTRY